MPAPATLRTGCATGHTVATGHTEQTGKQNICGKCGGIKQPAQPATRTAAAPAANAPVLRTGQPTAQPPRQPTAPVQSAASAQPAQPQATAAELRAAELRANFDRALAGELGEEERQNAHYFQHLVAASGGDEWAMNQPLTQQIADANFRRAEAERRNTPAMLAVRAMFSQATFNLLPYDDLLLIAEYNPTLARQLAEKGDEEFAARQLAKREGRPEPHSPYCPFLHPRAEQEARRLRASVGIAQPSHASAAAATARAAQGAAYERDPYNNPPDPWELETFLGSQAGLQGKALEDARRVALNPPDPYRINNR